MVFLFLKGGSWAFYGVLLFFSIFFSKHGFPYCGVGGDKQMLIFSRVTLGEELPALSADAYPTDCKSSLPFGRSTSYGRALGCMVPPEVVTGFCQNVFLVFRGVPSAFGGVFDGF